MTGFLLVLLYFALAGVAAFVLMQPKEFRVTRSTTIDASPKAVFDQINNLKNWETWSPWAKLDPTANTGYEGLPQASGHASSGRQRSRRLASDSLRS